MPIELSDFETRLRLTTLRPEDYEALKALQLACFPNMDPSTPEEFQSLVTRFKQGQYALWADDELVATASSLIIDESDYADLHDWESVSDNGFIRNHDPEGDTLYGIEMQVHPEWRGYKLSRRLYDARKRLCRELNLARIAIGGRIPGYAKHRDMAPGEYVQAVRDKRLYDPVLTAQLANGFDLKRVIAHYLPEDGESGGYATELEWANLDHLPKRPRQRRAVNPVRVAAVQYQMRAIQSFDEFARQVEFFVDTGADYRADFLLFPELFTLQLLSLVNGRPGQAARELAEFTPQYLDLFSELSLKYAINIVAGSQFTVEEDGNLYNIGYLFRRNGTIERQRKIHTTPTEAKWWGVKGGDAVKVFDTDRGRIAIVICYDIEFPELVRIAAAKGARILFVPYNTNDRYGHMRVRVCAQARCVENHVVVVTAGCVGNLPFVDNADVHYAQSAVLTPSDVEFARDGIAAEVSPHVETVLVHDVDTEMLRRHRTTGTTANWNDRRHDLYKVVWTGRDPMEV